MSRIRLNKVVKEFNITLNVIADFLKTSCNIEIDSLNDTITDEQYDMIRERFFNVKVFHEVAQKQRTNFKNGNKIKLSEEEEAIIKQFEESPKQTNKRFESASDKKAAKTSNHRKRTSGNWGKLANFKGVIRIIKIPFGGMK